MRVGSWRTLIHYPYEHLAYIRETKAETVLIILNFSYEKDFTMDEYIPRENWQVLVSNILESGKIIDLPSTLQPFEVSILMKE